MNELLFSVALLCFIAWMIVDILYKMRIIDISNKVERRYLNENGIHPGYKLSDDLSK
jgi:hypothetical protein